MATDLNKAILIGRLTRDPELRYTPNGTQVCSFSIANNRTYVTGGEKKEQVSYFNCIAWAKTGEVIAEYYRKGQRIGIEGRLQQRSWDDKEGNRRSTVEIVVDNFQFLTPKENNGNSTVSSAQLPEGSVIESSKDVTDDAPQEIENPFSDEDIPF